MISSSKLNIRSFTRYEISHSLYTYRDTGKVAETMSRKTNELKK